MTKLALIVAVSENGVIGKDNDLLWHIPEDMKHFKLTTSGHTIITGRRNYDSIPDRFRPLPNRENIVITRNTSGKLYESNKHLHIVNSLKEAIKKGKELENNKKVFIIGGGQIYRQCLQENLIDEMFITHVHSDFEGDTYFKVENMDNWKKVSEQHFPKTEKRVIAFTICHYNKIE